jgi:hypothetical protein
MYHYRPPNQVERTILQTAYDRAWDCLQAYEEGLDKISEALFGP